MRMVCPFSLPVRARALTSLGKHEPPYPIHTSSDYTVKKISKLIRHQTENYDWEFLFLAANEDAIATATSYGIDKGNASQVQLSEAGHYATADTLSRKIKGHRKMMQNCASAEELKDVAIALQEIVKEETQKHSR